MAIVAASCGTTQSTPIYLEAFTPEESGLNLVKLTDESSTSIISGTSLKSTFSQTSSVWAYNSELMFKWYPMRSLTISPDGTKIAFVSRASGNDNIMIRNANSQGSATQRTFRNVSSFCWGSDDKLYFSDINGNNSYISSVSATQGTMMNQLTNGSVNDNNPVTLDGKVIFFHRNSSNGPAIWSLDRSNGTLTSCASGYNPCLIPGDPDAFYCVRNTGNRSEIWYVNFVKGQETMILSDEKRSFANPSLSPDGEWIVCEGCTMSNINQKANLDIFVVRTDGSHLTQLTFNPANDMSPVWAKDGRSIYFISQRANKDTKNNIWRMNFTVE